VALYRRVGAQQEPQMDLVHHPRRDVVEPQLEARVRWVVRGPTYRAKARFHDEAVPAYALDRAAAHLKVLLAEDAAHRPAVLDEISRNLGAVPEVDTPAVRPVCCGATLVMEETRGVKVDVHRVLHEDHHAAGPTPGEQFPAERQHLREPG